MYSAGAFRSTNRQSSSSREHPLPIARVCGSAERPAIPVHIYAVPLPALLRVTGHELENKTGDLIRLLVQSEMSGVEEVDLRIRQIA